MYYVVQGDWAGVIKKDSVNLISQIGDVIVADTEGEDSIYSGQQIQVMIYPNDFRVQCSGIFFPYEVTYNVEIISGNQFGSLIEYFPYRRVQILTGLTHYWGMSAFNYIADSISVDSIETVTIRISTSDPGYTIHRFNTLYKTHSDIRLHCAGCFRCRRHCRCNNKTQA